MFKRKFLKRIVIILLSVSFVWTLLTLWVQYSGNRPDVVIGNKTNSKTAVIIYNPDPIYNLDEQVCLSFAEGLSLYDFSIKIIADFNSEINNYDLYVFCTNTYNWAPDWKVVEAVNKICNENKNVIAITLGSGSTKRAQKLLEETILSKGSNLIASKSYWLLKPNDENRMEENNVDVANDLAKSFGKTIGKNWYSLSKE